MPVRHPNAMFHPPNDEPKPVSSDTLSDPDVRDELAKGVLTDVDEQQIFSVRPSTKNLYHFVARGAPTSALTTRRTRPREPKEPSEHNDVMHELRRYLRGERIPPSKQTDAKGNRTLPVDAPATSRPSAPAVLVLTRYFADDPNTGHPIATDEVLARTRPNDYVWDEEVTRFVGPDGLVRHDIFGHSQNPRMSVLRPTIAIELIHSNPPSEATFRLMLDASRTTSLIVLFWFLKTDNYYFHCFSTADVVEVRSTWFILDGVVYQNQNVIGRWDDVASHGKFLERTSRLQKQYLEKKKAKKESGKS